MKYVVAKEADVFDLAIKQVKLVKKWASKVGDKE